MVNYSTGPASLPDAFLPWAMGTVVLMYLPTRLSYPVHRLLSPGRMIRRIVETGSE